MTIINETEEYDPPYNELQMKQNGYKKSVIEMLKKDPAHSWRMKTGIELVHPEPSVEEQVRVHKNWNLMNDKQKAVSDKKSLELFGLKNEEHFQKIMKEKWNNATINEEVPYVKFVYHGKNANTKIPRVAVIDANYKGAEHWKNKNPNGYVMGYKLNNIANKDEALKHIQEINDFASLLSANHLERYRRIKHFFPESNEHIRTYIRDNIKGLKVKKEGLYKNTDLNSLDDSVSF